MTYEPRIAKPFEEEIMLQSEPELQSSPDQWEDPFAEAEAESRERLGVWRDDADSVRRWIKQREPKLDNESDDEDLVGLKEQRKGLTVIGIAELIYQSDCVFLAGFAVLWISLTALAFFTFYFLILSVMLKTLLFKCL